MNKLILYGGVGTLAIVAMVMATTLVTYAGGTGLIGYHNNDIFVGTGYQWCYQKLGWNTPTCNSNLGASASDILVMKWNAQWDNCNANPNVVEDCLGAWVDNEWNGMVGGDGGVWHYKIIWVGPEGTSSPYWIPGGELTWGSYETIMDQGTSGGVHTFYARTTPNGYGSVNGASN